MHHESGDRPPRKSRHQTPNGDSSPLEAVRQLMAERAKFEKWLTDLEAKRDSTPPKVFERVQTDYAGRLEEVLEKLKEHSAAMREHADSLSEKLEELEESEQELLETKAESELRAQVGELAEEQWEKASRKLEKELSKLKQDQELISSDLKGIQELLSSLKAASKVAEKEPAKPAGKPAPDEEAGDEKKPGVDELEFLKSVIGTTPAKKGSPPPPAPRSTPSAPPPVQSTPRPTPAGGQAQGKVNPFAAKTAADKTAPEKKPEKIIEDEQTGPLIDAKVGPTPLANRVTGANPIVLRPSGVVEQPKTLKCGECGSMNYATEWYCERCGAELTAV